MKRVGILGGTFNPPHNGHIYAAKQTQKALKLDKILLIPDNIPPHKQLPKNSADSRQRLEMTHLAAKEIPSAEVSDMELKRGGTSYTVDTLAQLKSERPDDMLYFIMGTDMLLSFESWYKPQRILNLCTLAVVSRDKDDESSIKQEAEKLRQKWNKEIEIISCPALPVSSTDLRADAEKGKNMVPQSIAEYIQKNHLYGW